MSLVSAVLIDGQIDFPAKNSRIIIEENVGDDPPIHIHFGKEPGYKLWRVRLDFKYGDFIKFCKGLKTWDK